MSVMGRGKMWTAGRGRIFRLVAVGSLLLRMAILVRRRRGEERERKGERTERMRTKKKKRVSSMCENES